MRTGNVHPVQLVSVEHLTGSSRTAIEDMREVQLVTRTVRQDQRVAHAEQDEMNQDLRGEHGRLGSHTRNVSSPVPEEASNRRVDKGSAVVGSRIPQQGIDFAVE